MRDADGYWYVAYMDWVTGGTNDDYEVFLVKSSDTEGNSWETPVKLAGESGILLDSSLGFYWPAIEIDRTYGALHIIFTVEGTSGSTSLYHSKCNNLTNWNQATSWSQIDGGTSPRYTAIATDLHFFSTNAYRSNSIAVDSKGDAHVVYLRTTTGYPWYSYGSTSTGWDADASQPVQLDTFSVTKAYPAIDVDSSDTVHIAYSRMNGGNYQSIHHFYASSPYTSFSGPYARIGLLSSNNLINPSIAADDEGNIHIVCEHQENSEIWTAYYDGGTWTETEGMDTLGWNTPMVGVKLGGGAGVTDDIIISPDNGTDPDDVYYWKWDGSAWWQPESDTTKDSDSFVSLEKKAPAGKTDMGYLTFDSATGDLLFHRITGLAAGSTPATQPGLDPLIAYTESSATWDDWIRYITYASGDWQAEADIVDINDSTYMKWHVAKTSPDGSEQAVVSVMSAPKYLYVSLYDGTNWDDGSGSPYNDAKNLGYVQNPVQRNFAAAYEQSSGQLLIVTGTDTLNQIKYWVWDGSSWIVDGATISLSTISNKIVWIEMASQPGTNQIALTAVDINKDVIGLIWDGDTNSWGNEKKLNSSVLYSYTEEQIAVAYMQSGTNAGKAVFVHSISDDVYSWTWTGSAWEGSSKSWLHGSGSPYTIIWMKLAADPNSDDLLLAFCDYNEDIYTLPWDGSAWTSHDTVETEALGDAYAHPPFNVIFESNSNHSGHALIVYADTTGLRYQHSSDGGATWDGESIINDDDEGYWIQLARENNDVLHMAVHDIDNDLETFTWNNSTWTKKTTRETDLNYDGSHTYEAFAITAAGPLTAEITLGDHASGQIADQFIGISPVSDVLFRFSLTGDDSTQVDALNVNYTTAIGVWDADVTAAELYADDGTTPGVIDGSDTLIESGVSGSGAQLSFTTSFTPASGGTGYLVKATVSNLVENDSTTFSIGTGDIAPGSGSAGGSSPASATHTADAPPIILNDHTSGQVSDQFGDTTPVSGILFRFSLTGDDIIQVTALDVNYTTDDGVVDGDVTAGMLYADDGTTPGVIDGSDTLIESGASGSGGQLSFSTSFTPASGGTDYLVKATVSNLAADESTTFSMGAADLTVSAGTAAGTATDAIHIVGITTEFTIQIGGSADDSYAADNLDNASTYIASAIVDITAHMNGLSSKYNGGFRFTGLNIPQGATINSATFSGYVYDVGSDNLYCTIYGHDVGNAPDFSTNQYIKTTGQRPRTTASVTWQSDFGSTGWKDKDVTGIVQEIIGRGDWSSGNAIALLFISDDRVDPQPNRFRSYDGVPAEAAKLNHRFHPPQNALPLCGHHGHRPGKRHKQCAHHYRFHGDFRQRNFKQRRSGRCH